MNNKLRKKIASLYFKSEPIKITYYNKGLNEKYLIATKNGRFVLKIYALAKVKSILNFESRFQKGGFDVVLPLKNTNNLYFIKIDKKYAGVVYSYVSGNKILKTDKKTLFSLGSFLGGLHNFGSINFGKKEWNIYQKICMILATKNFSLRRMP